MWNCLAFKQFYSSLGNNVIYMRWAKERKRMFVRDINPNVQRNPHKFISKFPLLSHFSNLYVPFITVSSFLTIWSKWKKRDIGGYWKPTQILQTATTTGPIPTRSAALDSMHQCSNFQTTASLLLLLLRENDSPHRSFGKRQQWDDTIRVWCDICVGTAQVSSLLLTGWPGKR